MTGGQRDELVAARADAILAGVHTVEAYAEHFDAQMRRGWARKLLAPQRPASASWAPPPSSPSPAAACGREPGKPQRRGASRCTAGSPAYDHG